MSNRSLIFFVAFSISAHAAVVGLWPETKQTTTQPQDCSIEIGMVSLPRIDLDFTRDLSRLQHLAQMIQKQRSGQKLTTSSVKLRQDNNDRRIDSESIKQISNQILIEAITEGVNTKVSLSAVSTNTPNQNNNPVTASKAAPIYAINPAPVYPVNALRYGWEGEVWLKVIVDRSGAVGKIIVEQSSDYQILDQAAINTVRNWHFEPARIGKEATEGAVSIPIRFRIKRS